MKSPDKIKSAMKLSTLIYCLKEDQILLAMKKRGFGEGKWNGFGGKVKNKESLKKAAVRELNEESNLIVTEESLNQAGILNFYMDQQPIFCCHVFIVNYWLGEPIETEEMKPCWFATTDLPFSEMWAADKLWLPLILNGNNIIAEIYFNSDGTEVQNFSYQKITDLN